MDAAPKKTQSDNPPPSDDIIMSWSDIDAETISFIIPRFLVKRKAIMIAGAESAGKSLVLQAVCNMLGYGETWFDGTQLERSLCFWGTNESREEMKLRQRAWARMYGYPESPQMQDNLIPIRVESRQFDHEVERKRGRSTHSETRANFDLCDLGSVRKLIATCRRYMEARELPCGAVVFDTLTSLLPTRMVDDVARIVTAHMDLIANELETCCICVQHTWRSDNEKPIGPYSLSANLHGTFITTGGLTHSNDGTPTMRTVLRCRRLKNTNDRFALEFVGTVVRLGVDAKGKPVDAVVMRCIGYTTATEQSDSVAVRRAWIAQCLPPGRTAAFGAVCKLCGWDRGTPQYDWIREAIPMEWMTVVLSDGETRELRRIPRGKFESVECRTPEPPPNAPNEAVKPVHEPETNKKQRGGKRSNAGRKFGPIHIGTMNPDEFRAALDQPLGDDRYAEFVAAIQRMQSEGAKVTDLGARLISQINALANGGVDSMKHGTRLFARCDTVRRLFAGMVLRLRQQGKVAKPDDPPPHDEPSPDQPPPTE